ncbi:hypothetical protein CEXT_591041, partial [Caerostris extrusa]
YVILLCLNLELWNRICPKQAFGGDDEAADSQFRMGKKIWFSANGEWNSEAAELGIFSTIIGSVKTNFIRKLLTL